MARKTRQSTTPNVIPRSVEPATGIDLLKRLIGKADDLRGKSGVAFSDVNAWDTIARDYLTRTFGSESPNVNAVLHVSGDGGLYANMEEHELIEYVRSMLANKIKMLETCIEQLETDIQLGAHGTHSNASREPVDSSPTSTRVFVVHGHNHGLKESIARFLEKLGLEPIILHEKPNAGRTIIEKFSDYADVHFAVVLLTGDDEARPRGSTEDLQQRARQNVILELGYFLGKLGRARVCAIHEPGVEIPSDYEGVLFIPLDTAERWRFDLVRELRTAGFSVDANQIFSAD